MALWRDGEVTSAVHRDARSHAERLPVEATAWLEGQGVSLARLDQLAVVAGPGSFTGLRVGVAAIQGWAFAGGTPVVAVPTLDAVAADPAADESGASIVPMIDGQRGEVFFAIWQDRGEVTGPAAMRPEDAIVAIRAACGGRAVLAIGDGAVRYRALIEAAGWSPRALAVPLAESAVRLAATGRYPAMTPHALRPIYVRRPDAEVTRERLGRSS